MKIDIQIKEKLDGIFPIIAEVEYNVSILEYIYGTLSADERLLFDKYHLLQTLRSTLWNISILDLCKLLLKTEKYSLQCLINTINHNYKNVTFKIPISTSELQLLADEIILYQHKIKPLKFLRDNRIAHKDNKDEFNSVMLYDLRSLINVSKKIYNVIFRAINDSDFLWDHIADEREISMIKNLAKYESIRNIISNHELRKLDKMNALELVSIIKKS
jgi:hypothetical protein